MRGWILDLYAESPGRMVVWLKLEGGETRRLVDRWAPSVFVASDDEQALAEVERNRALGFSWSRRVARYERVTDREESEVLELVADDAKKLAPLAERVERSRPFGTYRLYNVDVPPEQMYFYENDLFPLAYCEVSETRDGLSWELMDDVWACEYEAPPLRSASVGVAVRRSGRLAKLTDPIESVELRGGDGSTSTIDGGSEEGKILRLVEEVRRLDPDIVFTQDGDSFVLPYLVERAKANGVADLLKLDREGGALEAPAKKGTSYFSYGKILFKPAAMKLRGRVHLDTNSSFVHRETGLDGFYEVSRVCRLPLHISSRASIGKALSSLQFYHATKDGILIPWKPALAESFKSRAELLAADRGGFVFEPELGVHEGIGELDFSSLFPSIMAKKNVSPETVRCGCCPDSKNRVPELGWNVCERRPEGIVSKAVKILIEKRARYKRLEQTARHDLERERCRARRDALKWVAVACLPGESLVLVRRDGIGRLVKIGDFIDGLVGDGVGAIDCPLAVDVMGVSADCRAKYCKVAYLIRKPNTQKLLSFVTEDGREIVTTPDHSFFVLREGEMAVKTAGELRVGELVPAARDAPAASEILKLEGRDSRSSSNRSDNQVMQITKTMALVSGDLEFVRVTRIKELDSSPGYVYCFQMAEGEIPGFFAGEGLVLSHNCFGYLGHSNAKFGRIDAHIAVCAWDRRVLVGAARVAERRGFRVMHGIVDSLWLEKRGAGREDYETLRREIEAETGFAISFEGVYKWIAFLPSKMEAGVPVINQYFGVYEDGRLKVRGIEARRHDTPPFFSKCQLEILELLAGAGTVEEARGRVDECLGVFLGHAKSLLEHRVPIERLAFTRNLSRKPGEYANRSLTALVADQLVREGVELHAGEAVQYVITDYRSKSPGRRAVPLELADGRTVYDARRYVELLAEACSTVLRPFRGDCSATGLTRLVEKDQHESLLPRRSPQP